MAAQPTYNAEAYERGRPGYSEPAVAHLLDALEIDANSIVLDLAAGTGKLTGELVEVTGSVIAVEPEPHMRGELVRRFPMVDVLDGHATNIPVPDGAVDAVTVKLRTRLAPSLSSAMSRSASISRYGTSVS